MFPHHPLLLSLVQTLSPTFSNTFLQADEPIYPAAWETNQPESFWFYDSYAQADFPVISFPLSILIPLWSMIELHCHFWPLHLLTSSQAKMQAQYGAIAQANAAWGTNYASWASVTIPNPGTKTGTMWNDVLTWYRNSKRNFITQQVRRGEVS
jgi:hypothetical protein